jgi:hypothetical protein
MDDAAPLAGSARGAPPPRYVDGMWLRLLAGSALVACRAASSPAVSTTELTAAEYDVAYRIAEAACDRVECRPGLSRDACVSAKLRDSTTSSSLAQCRSPIDRAAVQRCLLAVNAAACGTGAQQGCSKGELCPDLPSEGTT